MLHRKPHRTCTLTMWCAPLLPLSLCFFSWIPNHQTQLSVIIFLQWTVFLWSILMTVFNFMKSTINLILIHEIGLLCYWALHWTDARYSSIIFILTLQQNPEKVLRLYLDLFTSVFYFKFRWKAYYIQLKWEKRFHCTHKCFILVHLTIVPVSRIPGL